MAVHCSVQVFVGLDPGSHAVLGNSNAVICAGVAHSDGSKVIGQGCWMVNYESKWATGNAKGGSSSLPCCPAAYTTIPQ